MESPTQSNLVLINANIRTLDPANPAAQALAVRDGRILAVGRTEEMRGLAAQALPDAPVLDLEGQTVLPGFIDCHTHFLAGGFSLLAVDLRGAADPAEFVRRIADRVRLTPKGGWVRGGGWDQECWPEAPCPAKNGSMPPPVKCQPS